jgi:hypothetical protein
MLIRRVTLAEDDPKQLQRCRVWKRVQSLQTLDHPHQSFSKCNAMAPRLTRCSFTPRGQVLNINGQVTRGSKPLAFRSPLISKPETPIMSVSSDSHRIFARISS